MLAAGLLRIGVDGLMISPSGKGHARTELHAVRALAERGEHRLVVFVREPGAEELLAGVDVEVVRVTERLTIDWELRGMPRAAKRHRLDAMLTLSERLPLAGGPPTVVWLFESPLHRIRANRRAGSAYQRASDLLTLGLWKRSLRRAAHVAFGSHATEEEVLGEIPALRGRTSVVYPGLAPGFGPGQHSERGVYAFHLASLDARDNTRVAIEAASLAGVRLLLAGGARFDVGAAEVEFLGRVTDEELIDLYRGAAVYIDPTLFEGFGYGVLEAMACGAPVVASNITSIPEIVGAAGFLCDPRSPRAFADAIRLILDDAQLAAALRAQAQERAGRFTWATTGEGLAKAVLTTAASA